MLISFSTPYLLPIPLTHTHSKLINKSVPNTVDLRALTQISSTANKRARDEAEQENMTLVTESARAIGCHISDLTGDKILHKDPETIRNLLVELIRVRLLACLVWTMSVICVLPSGAGS